MRDLEKLVEALNPDYDDIHTFLADNPGACEKIVEFIHEWTDKNTGWKDNLVSIIRGMGPTDEDKSVVRQNARALIDILQASTGDLPEAESLATKLAEEDDTLSDRAGEIYDWVFEVCDGALEQALKANQDEEPHEDSPSLDMDKLGSYES